nr:hypothetical protein GCM10025699_77250 [Microbacterium flavescens]
MERLPAATATVIVLSAAEAAWPEKAAAATRPVMAAVLRRVDFFMMVSSFL